MANIESIDALLARFDNEPMPAIERWELGKRAERLAEEAHDQEQLYAIRMRLVGFANEVADAEAQLSLFLWCAYTHDSDPKRFPTKPIPDQPDIDLLWWYKWLVGMLLAFPQYSLAQIDSALDMMRSAYAREGVGFSGVQWAKLSYLLEVGSEAEIREQLATLKLTPDDEYSNCEACSRAVEASARWHLEDNDEALRLFDDILESRLTCGEEPESITAMALIPLVESGRLEEAAHLAQHSYPRIMSSPAQISLQAEHMRFFLISGNPAKAYELLSRHVENLWHTGLSPAGQLGGALNVLQVANLLEREGHGHLSLPSTNSKAARQWLELPPDHAAAPLTISEFIPLVKAKASAFAKKFDARNGNTHNAEALERANKPFSKTFPIDLGGREFAEDTLRDRRILVPSMDAASGTSREWFELALEMSYMRGINGSHEALEHALTVAENATEQEDAYILALQTESNPNFTATLRAYAEFKRSQGLEEFASKIEHFDWKLWVNNQPAGSPSEEDLPFLDLLTEVRHAESAEWRAELALLLIDDVGAGTSALFEQWEERGDEASHAELVAWDRANLHYVDSTLSTPEGQWFDHAEELHAELCAFLDRGELPNWGMLMAYAIAHARLCQYSGMLLEVLRCGNDYFTAPPPHLNSVLTLLEYQARVGAQRQLPAIECSALWGLTTVALYSGEPRDPRWVSRLDELGNEVLHPYLACRVLMDSSRGSADAGDFPMALKRAKEALALFDSVSNLRPSLTEGERLFMNRAGILEWILTVQLANDPTLDAYTTSLALVNELREGTNVKNGEMRLFVSLVDSANITIASGIGDPFAARRMLEEALDVYSLVSEHMVPMESEVMKADALIPLVSLLTYFDEMEAAESHALEVVHSLSPLASEWPAQVVPRLERLAAYTATSLPQVALQAVEIVESVPEDFADE